MPTSLTLKNIPDALYERLKAAAELHRRSLNSEAIVCLESVLLPNRVAPSDRVALIATAPLTCNERWTAFESGQLKVFVDGVCR